MYKAIFLFSWLSVFFSCKAQKSNTNNLADFITKKGDSLLKSNQLPGLFIGVLNKSERQYFNFGYAVPDKKMPFDSATLFEAGSITKTFTAYILEAVLQEKNISDSSSIISYLPDSVQLNDYLVPVTFYSLLNHTSGLPRLPENMKLANDDMAPYDNYTDSELYAYLKTAHLKPDGLSHYSNLGAGLAGVLAQRISGKDFHRLLSEYILLPFGIRTPGHTIIGQQKADGFFTGKKIAYWNMNALAPAGALQCTTGEMLSYLQHVSKPKNATAKSIIDKLLEPTAALSPAVRIGRAWHTLEQKNKPVIYWHNGGTYGFSTFAAFIKDTGQAVIVIINQFNSNQVSDGLGIAIMKKMLE